MSSHSVRIAKTIKDIDALRKLLKDDALKNEYSRGLFNGFELIRSRLTDSDPELIGKVLKKNRNGLKQEQRSES